MKNHRLFSSVFVVSFIIAASVAVLNACSDDDPPATPGADGGTPDSSNGTGTDANGNETPDVITPPDGQTPVDAGLLPDANCGDGSVNPYCEAKILPQYACDGIGSGDNKLDTTSDDGDRSCNNCLRKNCCDLTTKCIGNGKPPEDGGSPTAPACTELDICVDGCRGNADAGGCTLNCQQQADPAIAKLHRDWVNCWVGGCQNYPSWYRNGAELCGCLMGSDAGPCPE